MKNKRWIALVLAAVMAVPAPVYGAGTTEQADTLAETTEAAVVTETEEAPQEDHLSKEVSESDALPEIGEQIAGFTLKELGRYEALGADTLYFEHEKSGAGLYYMKNDDTNRGFSITYRTPMLDESDVNHVFEHGVLSSSEKYEGSDVFFDMIDKTYNTFVNAVTYQPFTAYPVQSQSEAQLLKMADFYLSCMVKPTMMQDERIFQREGLRYELYDKEEPITMTGTVFSEDTGYLADISRSGYSNVLKALYPGEIASNMIGMASLNYRDLTYEHVLEVYERNYHFDNSLILLYGDLDYRVFLEFLDEEYLSKSEKRPEEDIEKRQETESAPLDTEQVCFAPAYEGDRTQEASVIYYAVDLYGQPQKILRQYEIFADMLNHDSSVLYEKLREAGIPSVAVAGLLEGEKPAFTFSMENSDEEYAQTFRQTVRESLVEIAENGFDEAIVETTLKAKELDGYLVAENSTLFVDWIMPMVSLQWVSSGDTDIFEIQQSALGELKNDSSQQIVKNLAEMLLKAERRALVTTVPQPGLAEQIAQEQQDYLTEMKASMTDEELDQMIADTKAFNEWNAVEIKNNEIAIPVEDLPQPEEAPAFTKLEKDGITYYSAPTGIDGITSNKIYFDISGIAQEDLHYLTIYASLLGESGSEKYSKAELDSLMQQYLYDFSYEIAYPDEQAGANHRPMFGVSWYAMEEDYRTSMELLTELLQNGVTDDRDEMLRIFDKYLPYANQATEDPLTLAMTLSVQGFNEGVAFEQYVSGQSFYEFARGLQTQLKEDETLTETLNQKLETIKDTILRKNGLIVCNAGPESALAEMQAVSEEFLGVLPSGEIEAQEYDFPEQPKQRAAIVEASNYSTFLSGVIDSDVPGTFFPFLTALSNKYAVPQLRFIAGAYSTAIYYSDNLELLFAYSYADPNVKETVDILKSSADALESMELTEEELDGYIASCYASATSPDGALGKYMRAMENDIAGNDAQEIQKRIGEMLSATLEDREDAVRTLREIIENSSVAVVGTAEKLQQEEIFDLVEDYRSQGETQ